MQAYLSEQWVEYSPMLNTGFDSDMIILNLFVLYKTSL